MNNHTENHIIIGDYINNRIRQNYQWHFQNIDDMAQNSYKNSKMSDSVYQILYMLMNALFLNGNTLLWLSQESVEFVIPVHHYDGNNAMNTIKISDWQYQIISVLCEELFLMLKNIKKSENMSSVYRHIFLLNSCNDEMYFNQNTKQYLIEFKNEIDDLTNDKKYITHLMILIKSLFRFVYLSKFVFKSLNDFYEYLKNRHFCQVFDKNLMQYDVFFVLTNFDDNKQRFGIWLNRAFMAEYGLSQSLNRLVFDDNNIFNLDYQFDKNIDDNGLSDEQKNAVLSALKNRFTIITGGPGTGKTFTVAKLVLALLKNNPNIRLALTAPTGKAAQRMQESLQLSLANKNYILPEAKTIHRLIGLGKFGIPRHNAKNPIDADIIIVDEASMLGIELACQLFFAVGKNARIILLGDIHQLSAVEAGAVLSDLCTLPALMPYHQTLSISRRFKKDSAIDKLAKLIHNANRQKECFTEFLNISNEFFQISYDDIKMADNEMICQKIANDFMPYFEACANLLKGALSLNVQSLFEVLGRYRILTATHLGDFGDEKLNTYLMHCHLKYYQEHIKIKSSEYRQKGGEWYHGRVVMIIKNAYDLGLFNGDIGICVANKNGGNKEFVVYFDNKTMPIPISLLSEQGLLSNAYAMTIHKSQGSEFEKVAICFDDSKSQILGKELFYTAITRAKESIALYSHKNAIILAMTQQSERQTGLGLLFNERLLNNDK